MKTIALLAVLALSSCATTTTTTTLPDGTVTRIETTVIDAQTVGTIAAASTEIALAHVVRNEK